MSTTILTRLRIKLRRIKRNLRRKHERNKETLSWIIARLRKNPKTSQGTPVPGPTLSTVSKVGGFKKITLAILVLLVIPITVVLVTYDHLGKEKHDWWEWLIPIILVIVAIILTRKAYHTATKKADAGQNPGRTEKTENKKSADEKGRSYGYVWFVLIMMLIVGLAQVVIKQYLSQEETQVKKSATERPWEFKLEKPPGVDGINPDQRLITARATCLEASDNVLEFKIYFDDLNKTETGHLYLDRTKVEGVWNQKDSEGHFQLSEVQTITDGYCIRLNRSETPDKWMNGFLIPK